MIAWLVFPSQFLEMTTEWRTRESKLIPTIHSTLYLPYVKTIRSAPKNCPVGGATLEK